MEGAALRLLLALALAAAGLVPAAAGAQKPLHKDLPVNDPRQCPYCEGDPARMAAAGVVSHGGFEFAKGTTKSVDEDLAGFEVFWIETRHHEIGLELAPYKISAKEREDLDAELAELRTVLPAIPEKLRSIDPWLRAHLYAARMERLYAWTLETLGKTEEAFPAEASDTFDPAKGYFGLGPHLGMKDKYEVLVLTSKANCNRWLRETFGILTQNAQRWHVTDRGTLMVITHLDQGSLRVDEALHGHLVFNQVQNFLNGYKHFSYEKPIWLLQGIAHWAERQVSTKYNTFDGGEGAAAETTRKENWEPPTRKLVAADESASLGALIRMKSHGELDLDRHFTTWSMVDYLQREHPGAIGKMLDSVSGLLTPEFMPDGGRVEEATRDAFREHLGMTTVAFEQRWKAWVLETYSTK